MYVFHGETAPETKEKPSSRGSQGSKHRALIDGMKKMSGKRSSSSSHRRGPLPLPARGPIALWQVDGADDLQALRVSEATTVEQLRELVSGKAEKVLDFVCLELDGLDGEMQKKYAELRPGSRVCDFP